MRNFAILLVGEIALLAGLAVAWWPLASIVFGAQLVAVGLLSEAGGDET